MNRKTIKVNKDGFVWRIVSKKEAQFIWEHQLMELYVLYDDDSEGLIETSKHIKISLEEGKRLWALVQAFHNGHEFRHDLALDLNGHQWKINSYKNDILTAGCHTIHFSECQEIANQLGW